MKILVLSDTHGNTFRAENILQYYQSELDMVFHLGDHDEDARELQQLFPELAFHIVAGNNDYSGYSPANKMVFANGKKFLLTHGHKKKVYWNLHTLSYWAEEQGADMVLFGHTHVPFCDDRGNVFIVNPGSISLPRDSKIPTFALLSISETGEISCAIMEYLGENKFCKRK